MVRQDKRVWLHNYELGHKKGYFKNVGDTKAFDHTVGSDALGPNPAFGPEAGLIQYGSMTTDQRVRIATRNVDYMTTWEQWLDVQNGANLRHLKTYEGSTITDGYRFITTPRDLCTYVHYDAYFNACLILLGMDIRLLTYSRQKKSGKQSKNIMPNKTSIPTEVRMLR